MSYQYGDAAKVTDTSKDRLIKLKHITPTHFASVIYDAGTREVLRSAGGTYSLKGTTYKEIFDSPAKSASPATNSLSHAEQRTTKWYLSGSLSTGLKIEEVWERVRRQ